MGTQHDDDNDEFDTEIDGGTDDGTDEDTDEDDVDPVKLAAQLQKELDEARASNARMEARLRRANREAARRRHGSKNTDDEDSKKAAEEAETWRARSLRAEARNALVEADAKPERLSSLVRMLNLKELDYEGDDLVGIDEQIEDLRKSVPELFKSDDTDEDRKPTKQRPSIRLAAGNRKSAGNQVETADATTLQVRALRSGKV